MNIPTGDLPVPHDVSELLTLMRTAVDVLSEKYPTLSQPTLSAAPSRTPYLWESFFVSHIGDVAEMLNDLESDGWEVFNCLAYHEKGEPRIVAIARKPK